MSIVANVSLSLHCVAHGPPEPVRVIWLQDGVPLNTLSDPVALSPSTLNVTGMSLRFFTCNDVLFIVSGWSSHFPIQVLPIR